jgi:hypothetical protein
VLTRLCCRCNSLRFGLSRHGELDYEVDDRSFRFRPTSGRFGPFGSQTGNVKQTTRPDEQRTRLRKEEERCRASKEGRCRVANEGISNLLASDSVRRLSSQTHGPLSRLSRGDALRQAESDWQRDALRPRLHHQRRVKAVASNVRRLVV